MAANFDDFAAFVEIVERGSLTSAARHLRRSLQAVSRSLAAVEQEVGTELIRRTTRRLHVTAAGLALQQRLRAALGDIREAVQRAGDESAHVGGLFRIGVSPLFAPRYVVPAAAAFMRRYSDLEVELVANDSIVDPIQEHIDVSIRIGDLASSSLKSRQLALLRRVVCASPDYLSRHGHPRGPEDLGGHLCVVRTFGPEGDLWPITVNGVQTRVHVQGRFKCNDASSANAAVMRGAGIGMAPFWQVRDEIEAGRLQIILSEFEPKAIAVHAVWPGNGSTPERTRLFVDMLLAALADESL